MALYGRFGDDASPAQPSTGALVAGGLAGIVPLLLVAVAFWAVLAPRPEPRSTYRGRKH